MNKSKTTFSLTNIFIAIILLFSTSLAMAQLDVTGVSVSPVSGQLKVILGNEYSEYAYIQLFDHTGRMVASLKSTGTENSIDMGSLTPGLYHIKASIGGKSIVQQLVKE